MTHELHRVVGIDLGTTYSAVAACPVGTTDAEIIVDADEGPDRGITTPSVVWWTDGRVVVGRAAEAAIATHPADTLVEVKRLMGTVYDETSGDPPDVEVAPRPGEPPRKLRRRSDREPADAVRVEFAEQWRLPQEIGALVLQRMKQIAEAGIGAPIHDAVVTVPAHFMEPQRTATKEAALLAGLYPRQLIPEPTAAAVAYGVDRYDNRRRNYLVYDLGGGTFDVSIVRTELTDTVVVAHQGIGRLGGADFDDAIAAWAVGELGLDPVEHPELARRLKANAKVAKEELTDHETSELAVPRLPSAGEEWPESLTLTRVMFEDAIRPLIESSLETVDKAIAQAKAKKGIGRDDIDGVLLVGGSTRVPLVTEMLERHFGDREEFVKNDAHPDTLVARGAAMAATRFLPSSDGFSLDRPPSPPATLVLSDGEADTDDEIQVVYTVEHTLGVGYSHTTTDASGEHEAAVLKVAAVIEQGTPLPVTRTCPTPFTNPSLASEIRAPIYQGESEIPFEDTLIGHVPITVEPAAANTYTFVVTFSLDIAGLLSVKVLNKQTDNEFDASFEHSTRIGEARVRKADGTAGSSLQVVRDQLPALADSSDLPPPVEPAPTDRPELPPPVGPPDLPGPAEPPVEMAEVPPDFRRTVERARQLLADRPDGALLAAYNEFARAVNAETTPGELETLFDRLADAFSDARRS